MALLCALSAEAPAGEPGVLEREAARLSAQAHERRQAAGSAVDLIRLWALRRWVPPEQVIASLGAFAQDERAAPLCRAVAWWLLRRRAVRRLDGPGVEAAVKALGLLDGFVLLRGRAPHPTADLQPGSEWRPYPRGAGSGVLWLDAFVRPAREASVTLASRIHYSPGGPAVLRIGYDDEAKVWLNGDEVYVSPAPHEAWLDQAAIPVVLRPGDNRLVIEVGQSAGAWRLLVRFTDPDGTPLEGLTASPDPWGPLSEIDVEGQEPPESFRHLWRTLAAAADVEPPPAQALRDLADYARITGLPDPDLSIPRVAVEGAWASDPSPRSLRAWLRILPEAERGAVRSTHLPIRPISFGDHAAELATLVRSAWEHYYADRLLDARHLLDRIDAWQPGYPPALRLRAALLESLDLQHTAVARLRAGLEAHPGVEALEQSLLIALQSSGRDQEARVILRRRHQEGRATADDRYQLAQSRRNRGDLAGAVALLDEVYRRRPELWSYALEAAAMLRAAGDWEAARVRLQALEASIPGEPMVLDALARLLAERGDRAGAAALVRRASAIEPANRERARYLKALTRAAPRAPLGPPLQVLLARPDPPGADAVVLYHHATTEISASGLASRRVRRVVRLLTDAGARAFDSVEVSYVPGSQRLDIERARLLRDGRELTPARGDVDLSAPEYRLYYDLRAEVLTFPRPQPGDVIEVAWRLDDVEVDPAFPGYYGELAYLQGRYPRAHSVVELSAPIASHLAVKLIDHGLAVRRVDRQAGDRAVLRFESRDVPGVPWEPAMPGASSLLAHVHASNMADWADVDRRYRALLRGRDQPDRRLAALARGWAGQPGLDTAARLARLYTAVAERTRYVGLELGIHSFQPERPAVTLARGYGDCKDKATLLIALARALDIEARLTLVRTRSSGSVAPEPASLAIFDHAIVYIPSLDRFMDPTVDRNDPWTLPPSDQEAFAFVIGDAEGPRQIPAQPSTHNLSAWSLDLRLRAGGRAAGEAVWTTRGQPATLARRALEAEGQRRETLERFLGRRFSGVSLGQPQISGLKPALDPVVARASVELPALARVKGGFELPVGGGQWSLVAQLAQAATRRVPLALEFKRLVEQQIRLALPANLQALPPPPARLDSPFGHFEVEGRVERAGGGRVGGGRVGGRRSAGGRRSVLVLRVSLTLDVLEVKVDRYDAFRRWLGEIDRALAAPVALRSRPISGGGGGR